jgi:hypothetical protein
MDNHRMGHRQTLVNSTSLRMSEVTVVESKDNLLK